MTQQEYKQVELKVLQITIDNAGNVTYPSNPVTDKEYKNVVGIGIHYDDDTNLPGSRFNIRFSGKPLWKDAIETALITFNQACPVSERYYNYMDIPVAQAQIELEYTPGSAFPAGDTTVTVYLQCTKD